MSDWTITSLWEVLNGIAPAPTIEVEDGTSVWSPPAAVGNTFYAPTVPTQTAEGVWQQLTGVTTFSTDGITFAAPQTIAQSSIDNADRYFMAIIFTQNQLEEVTSAINLYPQSDDLMQFIKRSSEAIKACARMILDLSVSTEDISVEIEVYEPDDTSVDEVVLPQAKADLDYWKW